MECVSLNCATEPRDSLQDDEPDNILDLSDEDFEDVLQGGDVLPGRPLMMADRYLEGRIVIIAHVRITTLEKHDGFCATVNRSLECINLRSGSVALDTNVAANGVPGRYIEKPMLVRIIEMTEEGEKGREILVPSIVRLHSLNLCLRRWVQVTQSAVSVISPFFGLDDDGELQVAPVGRGIFTTVADGQSIHKMVEGGTEIVDTVACDQGPAIQGRRMDYVERDSVTPNLDVDFFGDHIGLPIDPCPQFAKVEFQLFFGVADFQEGASELRTDHQFMV